MRSTPVIIAATALAVGAGALLGVGSGAGSAEAADSFRVTPEQLQINQRISQAAVRRSNEALGLLGPVRPAGSTDTKPVNPFPAAQRGKGWPTIAYADDSVTDAKLAPAVRDNVQALRRIPVTRLTNGQTATLLTVGPLTFTARCRINQGGQDIAEVLISTTVNGAVFDGTPDGSTNLNPATPEDQRQYLRTQVATGTPAYNNGTDGSALAPDGTAVTGTPFAGINLPGRPAGECTFGGYFVTS